MNPTIERSFKHFERSPLFKQAKQESEEELLASRQAAVDAIEEIRATESEQRTIAQKKVDAASKKCDKAEAALEKAQEELLDARRELANLTHRADMTAAAQQKILHDSASPLIGEFIAEMQPRLLPKSWANFGHNK